MSMMIFLGTPYTAIHLLPETKKERSSMPYYLVITYRADESIVHVYVTPVETPGIHTSPSFPQPFMGAYNIPGWQQTCELLAGGAVRLIWRVTVQKEGFLKHDA